MIPSQSSSERSAPGAARGESAPAIRLVGVHKRFRKFTVRGGYTTIKTSLVNRLFRRGSPVGHFVEVLDGIDLEVPAGTTLGIIGRNGSGKSTLLKIMAGIIRADGGEVEVRGRVSPLIELGAGFHPEFSGRENVYLNALVIGMSRAETEERYDRIVEFAGLADVIDDPVRTYSSGMYMRLAFSVAVHADPDVLLVDEILAVGDEGFIAKCEERLESFQAEGKTIVMVSHGLDSIERWCHQAIWVDAGRIVAKGDPSTVTWRYRDAVSGTEPVAVPTEPPEASPGRPRAELRVLEPPYCVARRGHGAVMRLLLELRNVGDTRWRALVPTRRGMVMVGGHLYQGDRLLGETKRALLPRDIAPGGRTRVEYQFELLRSGTYRLELDLVEEFVCWFRDHGSQVLTLDVSA